MSLLSATTPVRHGDPTPYELKLAGAIEEVFGTGVHHLEGLVEGSERASASTARAATPGPPTLSRTRSDGWGPDHGEPTAQDGTDRRRDLRDRDARPVARGVPVRLRRASATWRRSAASARTGCCSVSPTAPSACSRTAARTAAPRCRSGQHLGDRVACAYHGVQVDGDGTVVSVPGHARLQPRGQAARHQPRRCRRSPAPSSPSSATDTDAEPAPLEAARPLDRRRDLVASSATRSGRRRGASPWRTCSTRCTARSCTATRTRCSVATPGPVPDPRNRPRLLLREDRPARRELRLGRILPDRHRLGRPGDPLPADRRSRRVVRHRRHGHADRRRHHRDLLLALPARSAAGNATSGGSSTGPRSRSGTGTVLEQDRDDARGDGADADQAENLYQHDLGVIRLRRLYRAQAEAQAKALQEA